MMMQVIKELDKTGMRQNGRVKLENIVRVQETKEHHKHLFSGKKT
jgi:hypothetical protein